MNENIRKDSTEVAARALYSKDGDSWHDCDPDAPGLVTKIAVGENPPKGDETPDRKALSEVVRSGLKKHWDTLTHLHLWSVEGLDALLADCGGKWPTKLQTLDLSGCDVTKLEGLPDSLTELDIGWCGELVEFAVSEISSLDRFYANYCPSITTQICDVLIAKMPHLLPSVRYLDLSGWVNLAGPIAAWPPKIEDLRLNECPGISRLPDHWPDSLRRVEIRNSTGIKIIPDFTDALDYLDLRGTRSLQCLPEASLRAQMKAKVAPRTLLIHGSGLELPDEMFGDVEFNSAGRVCAHLGETDRVQWNEVKVILVGDGRAGKSSLARRLVENRFDDREISTHGIRLWRDRVEFTPEEGGTANLTLNFWDFAGQDLYHNTHRLFFQSKAVFVLCANECPDGACEETDVEEAERQGEEVRRNLNYWIDQVESLGAAPGMTGPPPLVIVRTKSDRDEENPAYRDNFYEQWEEEIERLGCIDFSAKDGNNADELSSWIAKNASRVLGAPGKREIGRRPLKVKETLEEKMLENDRAHRENDPILAKNEEREIRGESPEPLVPSPHPKITRDDFHQLVREFCPDGAYHENPDFLLSRFHLGGFLYHDSRFLEEVVILDQRWAIQGIYAGLDRERSWPVLEALKGRFRPNILATQVWNSLGYDGEDQIVFLQFMESCGLIFPLSGESGLEAEYVFPAALPRWGEPEIRRQANDRLRGIQEEGKTIALEDPFLSRDAMMQLLVRIGRKWQRASDLWRWGGQFESYRHWDHRALSDKKDPTFVRMNWAESSDGSYGGRMLLTRYGPDESFLAAILNECREIGDFREIEIPEIDLQEEAQEEWRYGRMSKGDRTTLEGHQSEVHANPVTIGISFKGDFEAVESIDELPENSIERWPLSLAASLRKEGFEVEEYRIEHARDQHDQAQHRKEYLDSLTDKNFMIAILSWPYLQSPWCMYEFLQIFRKMGNGKLDATLARIGSYRDSCFSQGDLNQRHSESKLTYRAHMEDYWEGKYKQFDETVGQGSKTWRRGQAGDAEAIRTAAEIDRAKKSYAYADWMDCVAEETEFESILDSLANWAISQLSSAPTDAEVDDWVDQVKRNTLRGEVLLEYAKQATDREHGMRLFLHGFLNNDPDGQPEGLESVLSRRIGVPELDSLRNELRGIVLDSDGEITTVEQLDAELVKQLQEKARDKKS